MHLACFEREPQRLARAEQMGLADDFIERVRAQPFGQWGSRRVPGKKIVHGRPG